MGKNTGSVCLFVGRGMHVAEAQATLDKIKKA
jgi:hypothetical protein